MTTNRLLFVLLLVILPILFLNTCADGLEKLTPQKVDQIKIEVQQSFETLVQATEELDWESYFAHFDQNKFSGLNADGTVWTSYEEFRESVLPAFESIERSESLEFATTEIMVIDSNTAVLVNEYEQQILLASGQSVSVSGGGAQVWSKAGGTWKLVSVSASAKP